MITCHNKSGGGWSSLPEGPLARMDSKMIAAGVVGFAAAVLLMKAMQGPKKKEEKKTDAEEHAAEARTPSVGGGLRPPPRQLSHGHDWDIKRTMSLKASHSASFSLRGPGAKAHLVYVPRIVLTGGPCGGKSSSMNHLKEALLKRGYDIYFAPEVATLMLNGGCVIPDSGKLPTMATEFQFHLLSLQRQMERSFVRVAAGASRPAVVILDRGLLDSKAYLPDSWQRLCDMMDTSEEDVLKRYDAVVHLVSAADGAEQFYTSQQAEGFDFRKETPEQAKDLDKKLQAAWSAHPNHFIIDNSTNFQQKLERATEQVIKVIMDLEDK